MILMAIDHVRVYSGVPPGGPTPAVFFSPWLFTNHPMGNPEAPEGYVWSLSLLYLVWGIAIVVLYFGCRWFAQFKAKRNAWWLKYL